LKAQFSETPARQWTFVTNLFLLNARDADSASVGMRRVKRYACEWLHVDIPAREFPMDPLQVCAEALVEYFVTDKWLAPRLSALTQSAGLEVDPVRRYGLVETITTSLAMT
jgi:hypothetical protein